MPRARRRAGRWPALQVQKVQVQKVQKVQNLKEFSTRFLASRMPLQSEKSHGRLSSGIVNRITGIGYLVRTSSESVRTGMYWVQTGTGNV